MAVANHFGVFAAGSKVPVKEVARGVVDGRLADGIEPAVAELEPVVFNCVVVDADPPRLTAVVGPERLRLADARLWLSPSWALLAGG